MDFALLVIMVVALLVGMVVALLVESGLAFFWWMVLLVDAYVD